MTTSGGGSISPYQTKNGRKWEVRWRGDQGESRRKKGFDTKKAATLWLAENRVQRATGTYIDESAGRVTIGALWETFIATKEVEDKATTASKIRFSWSTYVEPRWSRVQVGAVKTSAVRLWVAELQKAGVGPATIETAVNTLRGCIEVAVEDNLVARNVASGVKAPRRNLTERTYLDAAQVRMLADEMPDHLSSTVVWWLCLTGTRWGEMAELRVRDLQTLRCRASIERAMAEVEGVATVSTPKTSEVRQIAYPESLGPDLARLMEGRGRDELVFSRDGRTYLRVANFRRRVWYPAVERCQQVDPEFPRLNPHGARHTAASLMIQSGASIKVVQRQLGHSSAAMTLDQYGHLYEDDLDEVAGRLDRVRRGLGVASTVSEALG
jgi:integrase